MAISDVTLKQYLSEWWQNTRAKEQGGLRLTNAGFEFVRNDLDLATYDVPFPKDFEMTTNTIIWLDQNLEIKNKVESIVKNKLTEGTEVSSNSMKSLNSKLENPIIANNIKTVA